MTYTQKEAIEALKKGFPEKVVTSFPYGELLDRMWQEHPEYHDHYNAVIMRMDNLLSENPGSALRNCDNKTLQDLKRIRFEVMESFGQDDIETVDLLFRLAALYHDIGKYIIKERHPTIGWYAMEYLKPDQRNALLVLLNNRRDLLEILLVMIRDHDEFGVLTTGEGSYPILLNAATSLGNLDENRKKIISSIMWLNIADIAGIFNPQKESILNMEILKKILHDWNWYKNALEKSKNNNQTLEEFVIKESSSEDLVVERISRLLIEASRRCPRIHNELTESSPYGPQMQVHQLVRNQFRRVYTTHNQRKEFASEFSHVCKLDYGLRFFERLIEYCENGKIELPILIYTVFAVLRRITGTYRSMIRSEDGLGNLIGVEMKDLTPDNAKEKTTEICKLLVEQHYPGLSWLMSDCPAWFF